MGFGLSGEAGTPVFGLPELVWYLLVSAYMELVAPCSLTWLPCSHVQGVLACCRYSTVSFPIVLAVAVSVVASVLPDLLPFGQVSSC